MKDTHDKEWILQREQNVESEFCEIWSFGNNKNLGQYVIPKSLLDQIRRDAVDEYSKKQIMSNKWILDIVKEAKKEAEAKLLDEIETLFVLRRNDYDDRVWNEFRAKTLGEQIK